MFRSAFPWGIIPAICLVVASTASAQQPQRDHGLNPARMLSANGTTIITIETDDEPETFGPAFDAAGETNAATEITDVAPIAAPAVQPNVTEENAAGDATNEMNAVASGAATESQASEAAPLPVPANETKSLGVPNGVLSARPVETKLSEESSATGDDSAVNTIIDSVDPRKSPAARVLLSLGLVLLLIVGLKTLMKRGAGAFGQAGRASGVIEILLRYPLDRKQSLVVLKIARRILLLHQNGTQMTTLCEMSEPMEVASLLSRIEAGSSGKQATRFKSMLKRFEAEHENASSVSERENLFPSVDDSGSEGKVVDLTRRSRRLPSGPVRGRSA